MIFAGHPDPRTASRANAIADRSGHARGTPEWLVAFRAAYAREAPGDRAYLAAIDTQIEQRRAKTCEAQP